MRYTFKTLAFEDMTTPLGREYGEVVIGGNRGDVYIASASEDFGGVDCSGVELRTSLQDLTDEEALAIIEEVVYESYASIGNETFIGKYRF